MLHEEVIRLELSCLDRKKLVKNEMTGCFERDDNVFQDAARWLGNYGSNWMRSKGEFYGEPYVGTLINLFQIFLIKCNDISFCHSPTTTTTPTTKQP